MTVNTYGQRSCVVIKYYGAAFFLKPVVTRNVPKKARSYSKMYDLFCSLYSVGNEH